MLISARGEERGATHASAHLAQTCLGLDLAFAHPLEWCPDDHDHFFLQSDKLISLSEVLSIGRQLCRNNPVKSSVVTAGFQLQNLDKRFAYGKRQVKTLYSWQ